MKLDRKLRLPLLLTPIPLLWIALMVIPKLHDFVRPVENFVMNMRFNVRGPLETPDVKIVYANIDARTIDMWGERPWPRLHYARFVRDLFEVANARVVGFDLVLSPKAYSSMVSREAIRAGDSVLSEVVDAFPKFVLAANYSLGDMPLTLDQRLLDPSKEYVETGQRRFPYSYLGILPATTFPETPGRPIVDLGNFNAGQVGFIDWNLERNPDPSPRWIPLFADSQGPYFDLNLLDGLLSSYGIPLDAYIPAETQWLQPYLRTGFFTASSDAVDVFGPGMERIASVPCNRDAFSIAHLFRVLRNYGIPRDHFGDPVTDEDELAYFQKGFYLTVANVVKVFGPEFADLGDLSLKDSGLNLEQLHKILAENSIPLDHFGPPEAAREMLQVNGGFYTALDNTATVFDDNFGLIGQQELENRSKRLYAFSLELALKWLGLDHSAVTVDDNFLTVTDPAGKARITAPLTDSQEIEVNWFSPWHDTDYGVGLQNQFNPMASVATISQQIVNFQHGEGQIRKDAETFLAELNDAIILVGPEDQLLQDLAPTPLDYNEVPKVSLHGNAIKTLLTNTYITRLGSWANPVFIILLTITVTTMGLVTGRFSKLAKLAALPVFIGYIGAAFLLFATHHIVVPIVAPVGSALMTIVVGFVYNSFAEEKRRSHIKGMFQSYLPPLLVNRMIESGEEPRLGGEQVEITAFFSDIQGFSSFSEVLPPKDLVDLMNQYLGRMTEILEFEGGTLDKYIGDAIVAMFNAPIPIEHHAFHACRSAARMQIAQAEMREQWNKLGDRWPPVVWNMQTRIGLNSGLATVGNMGSSKRFNYTMMGDSVNLAARCESGAKTYGVYIMVSGETMRDCTAISKECVFRFLAKSIVKGRSEPVELYELVCLHEHLTPETNACLETYSKGVEIYLKRDFRSAIELFRASRELEPNRPEKNPGSPTTPSDFMLQCCQDFIEEPPADDWTGVYRMKSK